MEVKKEEIRKEKGKLKLLMVSIIMILIIFVLLMIFSVGFNDNLTFFFIILFIILIMIPISFSYFSSNTIKLYQLCQRVVRMLEPYYDLDYFTGKSFFVIKIKKLYLIKFEDYFFYIVKMLERIPISNELQKRNLVPKLPTMFPLFKCKTVGKVKGRKIRACTGKSIVIDPEDHEWYEGKSIVFVFSMLIYSLTSILNHERFDVILDFILTNS